MLTNLKKIAQAKKDQTHPRGAREINPAGPEKGGKVVRNQRSSGHQRSQILFRRQVQGQWGKSGEARGGEEIIQ